MTNSGFRTTYLGLFDAHNARPSVTAIEIPIIQRDFAQGRADANSSAIRGRFASALIDAVAGGDPLGLDFVYGELDDQGVFRPLDGQQRLTSLLLLHWYLASIAGAPIRDANWLRFTYATRPTAQHFCESLREHALPIGVEPSGWIEDQAWYLHTWRRDPTVQGMLVMLDELHRRFVGSGADAVESWERLSMGVSEPIWFLMLTVEDHSRGEDLYIKMNSRGKPLTQFEVIKAGLEDVLAKALSGVRMQHLKDSFDGAWTDLFWQYEKRGGGDMIVDLEYERYLTFLMDVAEWRLGAPTRALPVDIRAKEALVGEPSSPAARNLDFFFHAFDTWVPGAAADPSTFVPEDVFHQHFSVVGESGPGIPLFTARSSDLFESCIAAYGTDQFSLAETFLLLGVLLARQDPTTPEATVARRLRALRNIAESAFLDRKRIPEMVGTIESLMIKGSLSSVQGFNAEWARDEERKWHFLDDHPDLESAVRTLEDQSVLRGRLVSFDLDTEHLAARAKTFAQVSALSMRDAFGAALLTKGDYSRRIDDRRRQLGNSIRDDSWRDLLTTPSVEGQTTLRVALEMLLDDLTSRIARGFDPQLALDLVRDEWMSNRTEADPFDWRYYLIRYAAGRSAKGEGYYHGSQFDRVKGGFTLGRLRMLHGYNYQSRFTDVILAAVRSEGQFEAAVDEPSWWHREDPGMRLKKSGIEIRNIDSGFELLPTAEMTDALDVFLTGLSGVIDRVLTVPGLDEGGRWRDSEDRVQVGVRLVQALVDAGF